jgi:hypothetical protein
MLIANNPAVKRMCVKLGLSVTLLVAAGAPLVAPPGSAPSISAACHNATGGDTFDLSCAPPTVASDLFNEQNIVDATIPGQSATHAGGASGDESGGHPGGLSATAPGGIGGLTAGSPHAGFSPHTGFAGGNAERSAGHR